ncbi:type II toxin-antitoxin system death-on-curing family toxin [Kutzneria buriramensis]|uniref:Death-on-curing protein n=1 Tax=Kutzneria buriramensis TaxID=1045776 RepID=A0A3E0HTR7_9PSEU|nr:type II toxin-antitoxin system death-on-curing family toxin [Kutzneria buriramensis]REH49952.1 death-on-curing protein [Kutzneria buriramensis]
MTRCLTTADLLAIAHATMGGEALIRDEGLVDSAASRPRTTMFGEEAYPDLHLKAAALMHSVLRNHPLIDGNKRLAWVAARVFLALNGFDFRPDDDLATEFVLAAAAGESDDLDTVAATLREWSRDVA